jgi:hypothetical protein
VPLPSRSHSNLVSVPLGVDEAVALNVTVWFRAAGLGDTVNVAVGGVWTLRARVVVAVAPLLSVTRRPTLTVPVAVYDLVVVGAVPPSVS